MATLDLDALFPERVAQRKACEEAGGYCGVEHDGYGCTLPKDHTGPHKAHSSLGAVLAQWEERENLGPHGAASL